MALVYPVPKLKSVAQNKNQNKCMESMDNVSGFPLSLSLSLSLSLLALCHSHVPHVLRFFLLPHPPSLSLSLSLSNKSVINRFNTAYLFLFLSPFLSLSHMLVPAQICYQKKYLYHVNHFLSTQTKNKL